MIAFAHALMVCMDGMVYLFIYIYTFVCLIDLPASRNPSGLLSPS